MDNDARSATMRPIVLPEIVTAPAEIDSTNAQSFGDELHAAFGPGVAVVVADMIRTISLDSSGARCLLLAGQHAAHANAEMRLVTKSAAVLRVLRTTGADRLLTIYPQLLAALSDPLAEAPKASGDG